MKTHMPDNYVYNINYFLKELRERIKLYILSY